MGAAPAEHSGIASAVNNAVARAAGLLAVAVLPLLAGLTGAAALGAAALATGFRTAMLISGAVCAAGGAARRADHPQPGPHAGRRWSSTAAPGTAPSATRRSVRTPRRRPRARPGADPGAPGAETDADVRPVRPSAKVGAVPRTPRTAAPRVFAPAPLGPLTLRNRIIKAATFEGVTPGGTVSDELIEFHRRVAAGGAAMSTVAYLAVSPEGRTDRHCLLLNEDNAARDCAGSPTPSTPRAPPRRRRSATPGRWPTPAPTARPPSRPPAASPRWARACTPSTRAGIERITEDYRRAAALAVEAGFDSIEVHVGHNYLLSAFLSPKLNRRDDQFGGSVENRARFARTVLRTVRDAAGPTTAVTAKLNMADGVDGGLWLDESVEIATLFEADGALDALELTGGSSLANPMYLFRGDAPLRSSAPPCRQRSGSASASSATASCKAYPYEEAFFLPYARQFQRALSTPVILLGGITELATIESALAEGFAFVAMARALLREPDLPHRMEAGTSASSLCIHCNKCMPTIYSGTRCVLVADRPGSAA